MIDCDAPAGSEQLSIFVFVFAGHVILGHLVSADFPQFIVRVFDTCHDVGLERIPLLDQVTDALRIGAFDVAQSLQISGLRTRA